MLISTFLTTTVIVNGAKGGFSFLFYVILFSFLLLKKKIQGDFSFSPRLSKVFGSNFIDIKN